MVSLYGEKQKTQSVLPSAQTIVNIKKTEPFEFSQFCKNKMESEYVVKSETQSLEEEVARALEFSEKTIGTP